MALCNVQHLYLDICIKLVNAIVFLFSIFMIFVSKVLEIEKDCNVFVQKSVASICILDGEWLPQRVCDHYHKFPRQLHLSSHYPTHLPMSQEPLKQEQEYDEK